MVVDRAVQSTLDDLVVGGLPGAFAYWARPNGESGYVTAGKSDLATGLPMDPSMHYRIGSTTKTFTAVVVLQLIEEGRMSLDDLVALHLGDVSLPDADSLTVEHLLRMRSGLFDFEDHPRLLGDLDAHLEPVTLDEVIAMTVDRKPSFDPGTRFEYCNSNFCLLERLVERVTGRSLGDQLRERIFDPLGLTETTYPEEDDLSLPEPYIHGYELSENGWRECSHVFFGRGDGAIISTAPDVVSFLEALLVEQTLLSSDVLGLMMTVVPDDPPPDMDYGMGLYRENLSGRTVWGHSGGGFGFGHVPFVDLETGAISIVMRNASFGFRETHSDETAARLSFTPELRTLLFD